MALDEDERVEVVGVADASFLIGLSMVGQLALLEHLVDRLVVGPVVWQEVVERGSGRAGQAELPQAGFIERRDVPNRQAIRMLQLFLGRGEAEALVLADDVGAAIFCSDDLRARNAAERAGMVPMGVAGALLAAKRRGLLAEIRPLLDELVRRGFRLGTSVIRKVVEEAGETSAS